jgi:hypothetical protein
MQIYKEEIDPCTDESKYPLLSKYFDTDYIPGKYIWSKTNEFKEAINYFLEYGTYCPYVYGSPAYEQFWDEEEYKIHNGMVNSDGHFICGDMYYYLNYSLIYNKQQRKSVAPDFWDSDAYYFIEVEKAKIRGLHFGGTKARQRGYSLKNGALITKKFYFEPYSISYIGAYVGDKADKTWEMIETNARHLDKNTPWHKNKNPYTKDFWKAQFQEKDDYGKVNWEGYMSELHKVTLKDNPSKGVGGAVSLFFYEEPGLAPTLLKTIEYVRPACMDGDYTTGQIIATGSVGEMKDCADLEKICYQPKEYGFAEFKNLFDEGKQNTTCGFFHPASWSYKGYIDEEGNSNVIGATARIKEKRELAKKKSPKDYVLAITQEPLSLDEAFQVREVNKFPTHLIKKHLQFLESTGGLSTNVDLVYDDEGEVEWIVSDKPPVSDFPVREDSYKDGVVQIFEFPVENPPYGLYVAGIDPYKFDNSKYSDSLGSVYIHKQIIDINDQYKDEMVACYTGRPESLEIWYDTVVKLLKFYNATALIENDVQDFIQYMLRYNLHQYLGKTPGWIKDVAPNTSVKTDYGVRATPKNIEFFDNTLIKYSQEEIGKDYNEDATISKVRYGIERIKDVMLLKEMLYYRKGGNFDRIRAYGITLAYSDGMSRSVIPSDNRTEELYKNVKKSPVKVNHFGRSKGIFTKSKNSMFR